jgi:hypothetical protein
MNSSDVPTPYATEARGSASMVSPKIRRNRRSGGVSAIDHSLHRTLPPALKLSLLYRYETLPASLI